MDTEIMTKKQLSKMLQVSQRTIERWIAENRVPYIRMPRRGTRTEVRFLRSKINIWITKLNVKPIRYKNNGEEDEQE